MPAAYFGSTPITALNHGSVPITQVNLGSVPVWTGSSIRDDFNRADADDLGAYWTDEGLFPYPDPFDFVIGIQDNRARVKIPDGLIGGFWDLRISRMRYNNFTLDGDDGFVEARAATRGDNASITSPTGYKTDVLGRVTDTSFLYGAGLRFKAGQVYIIRRNFGVDSEEADGGSFQPGDVARLTFVGDMHRLYVNGVERATYSYPTADSSRRSLGIRQDGAKDTLGPRRFSPALDYVMMG